MCSLSLSLPHSLTHTHPYILSHHQSIAASSQTWTCKLYFILFFNFSTDLWLIIRSSQLLTDVHVQTLFLLFSFFNFSTDLSQIIRSSQQLTDVHVQTFTYQLLRGLKYIHRSLLTLSRFVLGTFT
jgi:serine/threonine protein kinase